MGRNFRYISVGESQNLDPLGASFQLSVVKSLAQNVNIVPAHLDQPRSGHGGAHAIAIDKHDAGTQRTDKLIRLLHQLTTGGGAETRQMTGLELFRVTHVEEE